MKNVFNPTFIQPPQHHIKVDQVQRIMKDFSSGDVVEFASILSLYFQFVLGRSEEKAKDEAQQLSYALSISLE